MPARADTFLVYVIDDDASVRSGLSRLLRSAGLGCRVYASPEEFLADAPNATDGCVLLDITMPRMSGTEVQERLRAMDFKLPVIVVSASESDEVRDAAYALGARFFLRKPVDDQALLDTITWVTDTAARGAAGPRGGS